MPGVVTVMTENGIGDDGANALRSALETNRRLLSLNVQCEWSRGLSPSYDMVDSEFFERGCCCDVSAPVYVLLLSDNEMTYSVASMLSSRLSSRLAEEQAVARRGGPTLGGRGRRRAQTWLFPLLVEESGVGSGVTGSSGSGGGSGSGRDGPGGGLRPFTPVATGSQASDVHVLCRRVGVGIGLVGGEGRVGRTADVSVLVSAAWEWKAVLAEIGGKCGIADASKVGGDVYVGAMHGWVFPGVG